MTQLEKLHTTSKWESMRQPQPFLEQVRSVLMKKRLCGSVYLSRTGPTMEHIKLELHDKRSGRNIADVLKRQEGWQVKKGEEPLTVIISKR